MRERELTGSGVGVAAGGGAGGGAEGAGGRGRGGEAVLELPALDDAPLVAPAAEAIRPAALR